MICSAQETRRQEKKNLAEAEPAKVSALQDWESLTRLPTEMNMHVVRRTNSSTYIYYDYPLSA